MLSSRTKNTTRVLPRVTRGSNVQLSRHALVALSDVITNIKTLLLC